MKRVRKRPREWITAGEKLPKSVLRVFAPTKPQKLSGSIFRDVSLLVALVRKGSSDAAEELHAVIAASVQIMNQLAGSKPDMFAPIASKKLFWPTIYSPRPESVRETDLFVRNIGLGSKSDINLSSGKTFSWKVPANVIAINLHELARDVQRRGVDLLKQPAASVAKCGVGMRASEANPRAWSHTFDEAYEKQLKELQAWGQQGSGESLPPLSKQTAGLWATAADELFQIAYGRDSFETHPYLRALRQSVLRRAKDAYGKTTRGVIRKAMRQAVKQAWHSIAAVD